MRLPVPAPGGPPRGLPPPGVGLELPHAGPWPPADAHPLDVRRGRPLPSTCAPSTWGDGPSPLDVRRARGRTPRTPSRRGRSRRPPGPRPPPWSDAPTAWPLAWPSRTEGRTTSTPCTVPHPSHGLAAPRLCSPRRPCRLPFPLPVASTCPVRHCCRLADLPGPVVALSRVGRLAYSYGPFGPFSSSGRKVLPIGVRYDRPPTEEHRCPPPTPP